MIREMQPSDIPSMVSLAIEADMFPAEASDFLTGSAQGWFDGGKTHGRWIVDEDAGQVVGVAFYEPREATDRVWYLTMLAVSPATQGTGRGTAILRSVEEHLIEQEQRLLMIESSGTPQYEKTLKFYVGNGYDEVARVPDYFEDGDAMVLFKKDLRKA